MDGGFDKKTVQLDEFLDLVSPPGYEALICLRRSPTSNARSLA
jgi:hypothetical protein